MLEVQLKSDRIDYFPEVPGAVDPKILSVVVVEKVAPLGRELDIEGLVKVCHEDGLDLALDLCVVPKMQVPLREDMLQLTLLGVSLGDGKDTPSI